MLQAGKRLRKATGVMAEIESQEQWVSIAWILVSPMCSRRLWHSSVASRLTGTCKMVSCIT